MSKLLREDPGLLQCTKDFYLFLNDSESAVFANFFKELASKIDDYILVSKEFTKDESLSKEQKFTILSYLLQYCKTYEMFETVTRFSTKEEFISEVRHCICRTYKAFLDENTLTQDGPKDEISVGRFLSVMDAVLDNIAELNVIRATDLAPDMCLIYSRMEEILCLCMSIGQIGFDDDSKIIKAACRSVLLAYEDMKTEINKCPRNLALCQLTIDTCTSALCSLETKVNIAVLRLCLKIFARYKKPVQDLFNFCNSNTVYDPTTLSRLQSAFDLYMDRLFQISLFSITSSSFGKFSLDIKTIMTNLEFLQGEFIPACTTLKSPQSCVTFVKALKKCWYSQVKLLRQIVHNIIEPSAYCKLVHDELLHITENLWQQMQDGDCLKRQHLDDFVGYACELGQMFLECKDLYEPDTQKKIHFQLMVIQKVLNEIMASRDQLVKQDELFYCDLSRKIFKRCRVLQLHIHNLRLTVSDTTENSLQQDKKPNKESAGLPRALTKQNGVKDGEENVRLDVIVIKSKQILKDRSMCVFKHNMSASESANAIADEEKSGTPKCGIREHSYRHMANEDESDLVNCFKKLTMDSLREETK